MYIYGLLFICLQVDLLRFNDSRDEYLRDSLFLPVFQSTMLFDSFDSAYAYRQCQQQKQQQHEKHNMVRMFMCLHTFTH